MAAPVEQTNGGQNPNLIDDLESSFLLRFFPPAFSNTRGNYQNCLSLLTTQEQINVHDSEETKTSIETALQRFLELSRQTEAFFLRKRMLTSFQKPDQLVSDDVADLRAELQRKEQLLERHTERLKRCQLILQQQTATPPIQQAHPTQPTMQPPAPHPVPSQPHLSQGGTLPQYPTHHMQQVASQGAGMPQYQGYSGSMHQQPMPQSMPSHPVSMGPRPQAPPSYPQGPLAYLEQTTSNIGLPDRR